MRSSIALCLIAKNEENNIRRLAASIENCFDEVHLTDTGSTDKTVEIAKELGWTVHHFDWVNDFAAARNYSFSHATSDYIMWLDLDDVLSSKEEFIKWRDHALDFADYWLATYNYALDHEGKPVCAFARERAVKRERGFKWKYFVHEGMDPFDKDGGIAHGNFAFNWVVNHCRTEEDLLKDKSRNLNLFKERLNDLDARMTYYYGKELFEAGQSAEGAEKLLSAAADPKLEMHDRILAIQYASYAMTQAADKNPEKRMWYLEKAKSVAMQGMALNPHRAEYFNIIGDAYLKQGRMIEAIPFFQAAKSCINQNSGMNGRSSIIFSFPVLYNEYPRNQLARIFTNVGDFVRAEEEIKECITKFPNKESEEILKAIIQHKPISVLDANTIKCDDIVITCPPGGLYEWDPEVAATRGVGGSETAVIELAKEMHKASGKRVIVFNPRHTENSFDGVEYVPVAKANEYFSKYEPSMHIAWRHAYKLTKAPSYVWSHDLITPGVDNVAAYDKVLCLSESHKKFLTAMVPVPDDKVMVARNGINPAAFNDLVLTKNPNKVVYASSPDRGMDRAMLVMDQVVKEVPDAELHLYYGFDNMLKMGMNAEVDRLMAMIKERPWVHLHGNLQHKALVKELCTATVWLYPTHFMETFCITALEMLACKVYPVVRKFGALQTTLAKAEAEGMATMLDIPCDNEERRSAYAKEVVKAIQEKSYLKVNLDLDSVSWASVAKEFLGWRRQ